MQRSPNLRNYRQFSVVKAPLATFDTIDLGDDDSALHGHGSTFSHGRSGGSSAPGFHSPAITGQSHASRSQLPSSVPENGELARCDEEPETQQQQPVSSADIDRHGPEPPETAVKCVAAQEEAQPPSADSTGVADDSNESDPGGSAHRRNVVPRIGSLKGSYIKKQDSSSSSSSSEAEDEAAVARPPSKAKARRFRRREIGEGECKLKFSEADESRDTVKSLTLEYLDPKSITSPSKRKAYERRVQRLQVKTSPIARPRSTTPINVHTLEEYVGINSPDKSPHTPTAEKLKITLPSDDFSARSPRKAQAHVGSDDEGSYFEFEEELLFSRTQYALVVDETGKLPPSPRKVLIPPTLSPATSRKVTPAEDLQLDNGPGTPKLLFYKSASPQHESQGGAAPQESTTSVTSSEEPGWANFSESTSDSAQGGQAVIESQNWADFPAGEEPAAQGTEAEDVLTVKIEPSAGQRCNIELLLTSSSGPNSSDSSPATPDSTVFEPRQGEQAPQEEGPATGDQPAESVSSATDSALPDSSQTGLLVDLGDCAPTASPSVAPALASTETKILEPTIAAPVPELEDTTKFGAAGLLPGLVSAELGTTEPDSTQEASTTPSLACDAPEEAPPPIPPRFDA